MKKQGFTLIELLAVIVILSVISLIATPMILGVIEDSRKSSFKITCNEIYDSYEQYEVNEELQGNKAENVTFEFGSNRTEREELDGIIYEPISKLNLKGELPKMGTYKILKNTRELVVSNNQYTCIRDGKRNEVLEGSIADNDITNPILKGISLSSTTNSIQVVVEAEEPDGMIVKYYYKINGEETISESNIQVYKGLEKNKEYEIEVTVENKSGLKSETIKETITTKEINNPEMKQISETPGGYEYATSRVIQIEYDKQEGLKYYLKSKEEAEVVGNTIVSTCGTETIPGSCTESNVTTIEANTWYEISSPTVSVVYRQNGTLYALTGDGTNTTGASTYTITKIDTSEPNINMSVGGLQTDRAVISAVCSDEESGITKYEYSKDNGTSWVDNGIGTSYTFAGLTKETSYTYKVRCTNGSGMTKEVSSTNSTLGMTNPTIKQTSQTPSSGYEYATNRVIQITYNNSNINSPVYYFKSSVGATVSSGVIVGVCGTSTNPGSCTGSNVTTLVANTWYQTSSATPSITYQANGTLYALTSDGTNVSGTSTYTVTKIDTSAPSVNVSVSGKAATFTFSDNIGISAYGVNKSNTTEPSYTTTTSTSASWTASSAGTYYVWVKDKAGNKANKSFGISQAAFGSNVTYRVDRNTYTELIQNGASALSPKSFTPSKSGYTFVGWREDNTATSSVLSTKVGNGNAFTLYAVFKRTLTASFNGNGATGGSTGSVSGVQYYNNGNVANPTITLPANGFTRKNYTFSKWNYGVVGAKVTLTNNITVTAQWTEKAWNNFVMGQYTGGDGAHSANYWRHSDIRYNGINFDNVNQIRITAAGYAATSPTIKIFYSNVIGGWDGSGSWTIWEGNYPSYSAGNKNFTTKVFDVSSIKGYRYVTIRVSGDVDAITGWSIEIINFSYR